MLGGWSNLFIYKADAEYGDALAIPCHGSERSLGADPGLDGPLIVVGIQGLDWLRKFVPAQHRRLLPSDPLKAGRLSAKGKAPEICCFMVLLSK